MSVLVRLVVVVGCLHSQFSTARCIPGTECDQVLHRINYLQHLNVSNSHVINNVSLDLREADGSTDTLAEFDSARVCPWTYEADYNTSRLPQTLYRARCTTETWCDHTNGERYECLPLTEYIIPVAISRECDIFGETEWTLSFEKISVACYPSRVRTDTEEICRQLD